jgi:hypothetical protein
MLPASIINDLMITEAASISDTSLDFYQTSSRDNPEHKQLCTRCCEKLENIIGGVFLNCTSKLTILMVQSGVFFQVRTEFLNTVQTSLGFKKVNQRAKQSRARWKLCDRTNETILIHLPFNGTEISVMRRGYLPLKSLTGVDYATLIYVLKWIEGSGQCELTGQLSSERVYGRRCSGKPVIYPAGRHCAMMIGF